MTFTNMQNCKQMKVKKLQDLKAFFTDWQSNTKDKYTLERLKITQICLPFEYLPWKMFSNNL